MASPMALEPEAQAVTIGMAGPLQPKRMAIMLEAMLAIIIGIKNGETRRGPRSSSFWCSAMNVAMPPMPVPEPLARPGKRELDAARRLIARHGMPLVLAVAEWVSLPPSKTDKGDASGKPYDGFWRRTLTGPRSLARHWDQVCLQMADDPHGRRLLAEHGILADKGETAQPPSAESTPKVPNYGIPDNLDRRVWKLLDPYDFDAGNDGFEAPRTLRRLLKRVPANDAEGERNAVLEALRAGRAFLDAVSREEDDGRQRKPAETGPASGRVGFIGGRGPKEVPACS